MTFSHMPKGQKLESSSERTSTCLSIRYSNIQTGVFGGIIMGALARMVLQQIFIILHYHHF